MTIAEFTKLERSLKSTFCRVIREPVNRRYREVNQLAEEERREALVRMVRKAVRQTIKECSPQPGIAGLIIEMNRDAEIQAKIVRTLTDIFIDHWRIVVACFSCGAPIPKRSKRYIGSFKTGPGEDDVLFQFWCLACGPDAVDNDGKAARYVDPDRFDASEREWIQ